MGQESGEGPTEPGCGVQAEQGWAPTTGAQGQQGGEWVAAFLGAAQACRDPCGGGGGEYLTHPQPRVEGAPDLADQAHGEQRMATQGEEVVLGSDLLQPQHLGEQGADLAFLLVGGQTSVIGVPRGCG